MEARSPYAAPRAQVADADSEFGEIKIFSARGRIGRVRYIAYTFGLTILLGILLGFISKGIELLTGLTLRGPLVAAGYAAILGVVILVTIQRAHDFNTTGWISLLSIIPLVNLIFWFVPGTDGENKYGKQTPPNGIGVIVLALIVPLIFVIGIVAAIALPAYQDYVKRAQTSESAPSQ
jgi:uncharacterized membrane protein YhaH (DUF805 family)